MVIKKQIEDSYTGLPITVNANTKGCRYMKDGVSYNAYISCDKCKNASWYDDDYCNNERLHFVEKDNIKTVSVYCEKYEVCE